jgi:hypothetical protein
MRDVGTMGESTFNLWCADGGLIANGSRIDRTGWDFFVEFPWDSSVAQVDVHEPAFECRIQVKSTDKTERKLSVKMSNLRRLITTPMPAFFVFIEFNEESTAQNAFIVHINENLISSILKRLHEIEQSDGEDRLNRRKMTIHYDEIHSMDRLDGSCLKESLLSHMGDKMSTYVANKKRYLETSGFEDGSVLINFTTKGEDNIRKLIDVSIGLEKEVDISYFKATKTRFGIVNKEPLIEENEFGKIEMPDVIHNAEGVIKFREDKLSAGLSFPSKLYSSPFNLMVSKNFVKIRIGGDFFDLKFNPFLGTANYSFFFNESIRLDARKFRDAIKLLSILNSPGKDIIAELIFNELPKLDFKVSRKDNGFDFSRELNALECAVKILDEFNIYNDIDMSFDELSKDGAEICAFSNLLDVSKMHPHLFKSSFGIDSDGFNSSKEVACIIPAMTPFGSHALGVILVVIGAVESIENKRFELSTQKIYIEKKILLKRSEPINNEDIVTAIEAIQEKYNNDYSVVRMVS